MAFQPGNELFDELEWDGTIIKGRKELEPLSTDELIDLTETIIEYFEKIA